MILLAASGRAEVKIPEDCRVKNQPPGRCGWCALETLARYHRIHSLYGLASSHASLSTPEHLGSTLDEAGVVYHIQYPGNRNREILRMAVKKGWGAAVGVYGDYNGKGPHILTLIEYGSSGVKVIDSNDKDRRVRDMSLEDFLSWWDGFAIVLEPPGRAAEPATMASAESSPR
jgi:hypothetical protein